MNAVAEMERVFMPLMKAAERACAAHYPAFEFNVWSSSTGGLTSYQGHDIGLECIFPNATEYEANCVALTVGAMHLTTDPKLCQASVGWGSGHAPDVTLELLESPVALTSASLQDVANRIPELVSTFERALAAWSARKTDA